MSEVTFKHTEFGSVFNMENGKCQLDIYYGDTQVMEIKSSYPTLCEKLKNSSPTDFLRFLPRNPKHQHIL